MPPWEWPTSQNDLMFAAPYLSNTISTMLRRWSSSASPTQRRMGSLVAAEGVATTKRYCSL